MPELLAEGDVITLPVAYLHMLITEDERIQPRTKRDSTPTWFSQCYDEGYVLRGRPATPDEIAADSALNDALMAYEQRDIRPKETHEQG